MSTPLERAAEELHDTSIALDHRESARDVLATALSDEDELALVLMEAMYAADERGDDNYDGLAGAAVAALKAHLLGDGVE